MSTALASDPRSQPVDTRLECPTASQVDLPPIELPRNNNGGTVQETAHELGKRLAKTAKIFLRDGNVVRASINLQEHEAGFSLVTPDQLISEFETVARLVERRGTESKPTTCRRSEASAILACPTFRESLPIIHLVSPCPVLVEREGVLIPVSGYDEQSGILACGQAPVVMDLERARDLLLGMLKDYRFSSSSDKSRALAQLLTPALIHGVLIPDRAPFFFSEANLPQIGKGYFNKLTAAIYNQVPVSCARKHKSRGVESLEEAMDAMLVKGRGFIELDNVRDKLDSQKLESFCTQDIYVARSAFIRNTEIKGSRAMVMCTSNAAHLTHDLKERACVIRFLKQSRDYQFQEFEEGDLLAHVRANQPLYLGAVFAIIAEWHRLGKPRTEECRHARRLWAQANDWIVRNLLDSAPLLDGHDEAASHMVNPGRVWLRGAVLMVASENRLNEWLSASDMAALLSETGALTADELKTQQRLIGQKMGPVFKESDITEVDGYRIERQLRWDARAGKNQKFYKVMPSPSVSNEMASFESEIARPALRNDNPYSLQHASDF
jgi:hypothetical protein